MKLTRSLVSFSLVYTLVFLSILPLSVAAQDSKVALQRGYRTGYSDGYMAGYRDVIDGASMNAQQHPEYSKADRAYNQSYGTVADYQDGYSQGIDAGYETGYAKKTFDAEPERYALAYRGYDPVVWQTKREMVDGQFLREFEGHLYLFTTKENWETFKAAPHRYVFKTSTSKVQSVVSR